MRLRRWFLPESSDVLAVLREQTAITIEGLDALHEWAKGDPAAAMRVRDCEHRADERKRALRAGLTAAFTTPLEPEDLFELSRGLDMVLNGAKDAVREAEVMACEPDDAIAVMASRLAEGCRELAAAFAAIDHSPEAATAAADRAVHSQRALERVYRKAMSALIAAGDLLEVAARRELYRRLSRTSDALVDVAERVWYSVLKET
jgi:uncharacterized protein